MVAWRATVKGTPLIAHFGRAEVVNAICRAHFIGALDKTGLDQVLADFENDLRQGHLQQADLLWRATLQRAVDLSHTHTPVLGTRAADVLHVACALELKLRSFLTFDERQRKLAAACGLKLVKL